MRTVEEQVTIIEKQLSRFDTLPEKLRYIGLFFEPDPAFTQDAIDQVCHNISQALESKHG